MERSEQLGELGYPHISHEMREVLIALLLLPLIAFIPAAFTGRLTANLGDVWAFPLESRS